MLFQHGSSISCKLSFEPTRPASLPRILIFRIEQRRLYLNKMPVKYFLCWDFEATCLPNDFGLKRETIGKRQIDWNCVHFLRLSELIANFFVHGISGCFIERVNRSNRVRISSVCTPDERSGAEFILSRVNWHHSTASWWGKTISRGVPKFQTMARRNNRPETFDILYQREPWPKHRPKCNVCFMVELGFGRMFRNGNEKTSNGSANLHGRLGRFSRWIRGMQRQDILHLSSLDFCLVQPVGMDGIYPTKRFRFDVALRNLRVQREGRAHSGIDDARSLAKFIAKFVHEKDDSFFHSPMRAWKYQMS